MRGELEVNLSYYEVLCEQMDGYYRYNMDMVKAESTICLKWFKMKYVRLANPAARLDGFNPSLYNRGQ